MTRRKNVIHAKTARKIGLVVEYLSKYCRRENTSKTQINYRSPYKYILTSLLDFHIQINALRRGGKNTYLLLKSQVYVCFDGWCCYSRTHINTDARSLTDWLTDERIWAVDRTEPNYHFEGGGFITPLEQLTHHYWFKYVSFVMDNNQCTLKM